MKAIAIHEITRDDMLKIEDLFKTREELDSEGVQKRMRLLEWLAFNNPFANGEPTYFIAEVDGVLVGHLGRMPSEFVINGRVQRGYFVHDLYVHPDYRKKGMGLFITMSLYKAIEENSKSFCCMVWTSELNLEFQRRRGYRELGAARYVKVMNPVQKLESILKNRFLAKIVSPVVKKMLLLADSILKTLSPSDITVSQVRTFDSRFDELNQRIFHKQGISSFKTTQYLNWRFIDRPFSRMTVFAAERNGQASGFIVVALNHMKDYPEGTIVDIMADPEDKSTILALLKAVVDYYRAQQVFSIGCCLTDKRFARVFKRFLFLESFGKEPVMLANLEKSEEKESLANIDNWHLTYAASDAFMLDP